MDIKEGDRVRFTEEFLFVQALLSDDEIPDIELVYVVSRVEEVEGVRYAVLDTGLKFTFDCLEAV